MLVADIRQGAGRAILGRRARLAANLNSKSAELQGFRDRIAKSNLALQTILQTITVSLSLRNNASQSLVLRGLDDLKASIDRAVSRSWQNSIAASRVHEGSVHPHADAQLNRNLRDLAQAAKHFHSAASSTAGSAANSARSDDDGASIAPWQSYPGADMSLFGDFSDDSRERVEKFVREAPAVVGVEDLRKRKTFPVKRDMSRERVMVTVEEEEFEDDDGDVTDEDEDAEFELAFVRGLQELISHHIRAGNYSKAVDFINEAMSNSAVLSCATLLRTLRSQLVLTHLLQGQWRLASSLLTTLARQRKDRDAIVCSLLHGLAVAHLAAYAFDDALAACKMALYGRRRLHKRGDLDIAHVNETIGLFATIYDMTGDYVRAEVLRGQLPSNFVYSHPKSAITFLLQEEALKGLTKGDFAPPDSSISVVPGVFELADRADNMPVGLVRRATTASLMSPLRTRICEHERLERDTAKEVIIVEPTTPSDADDEASPVTDEDTVPITPLRRRITQIFRSGRPRRQTATKPVPEQDEAADDSGYGTSSPVESASPVEPASPWRIRVRRSKTKKLLKKQPAKTNKEIFKLLNMESRAKVDVPKRMTDLSDSFTESSADEEPEWALARQETGGQLAELDTTQRKMEAEDDGVLNDSMQPSKDASPSAQGTNELTTAVEDSGTDEGKDVASSDASTRALRPSRLQIPRTILAPGNLPLTIPSLDPLNLVHQGVSPRLTSALSSLSVCFLGLSALRTAGEMDGTRIQLCYLLNELRVCSTDAMLKGDVEAAIRRLDRRSARLRKWEYVETERSDVAIEKSERQEPFATRKGQQNEGEKALKADGSSPGNHASKGASTRDVTLPHVAPQTQLQVSSSFTETFEEGPKKRQQDEPGTHRKLPLQSDPGDRRDVSAEEKGFALAFDELRKRTFSPKLSFERQAEGIPVMVKS